MLKLRPLFLAASLVGAVSLSLASEPVNGSFTASKACELYSSFAKQKNPDGLQTTVGSSYAVKEINKPGDYGWLRVDVPNANPSLRWVARDCGTAQLDQAVETQGNQAQSDSRRQDRSSNTSNSGSRQAMCSTANQEDSYVLAITWQPGFCEHFPYHGKKPECDAINSGKLKIANLTLHGLWPNKKECGINYGNCPGTPLKLSADTVSHIEKWMPNFRFETKFGEYEWSKHGVCQSRDADTYFRTAAAAVEEVNNSAIGKFIVSHAGQSFTANEFFDMVKKQEGEKVAGNILLSCVDGKYLQEIRLKLPVHFETGKGLEKLVGDADGFGRQVDKCGNQIVVEASGKNR
ncbi:ribonuclease I [Undibacterium sp. TS12]|uniref:ribonuclease T2 family protein n=1 Tax=Undibacterium sp. TS12 TaxID=2908202 RepID=UPI001F4CDB41|nr:ribonuclease I [Undibacterium sp. TS12]MCH8620400.1 ribonuclease I [Undibacterium sp. TS12]